MDADTFWQQWRTALQQHTGYLPRLGTNALETTQVMEIVEAVDSDAMLQATLERFLTLTQKERNERGVKALTIGYYRMCLPALMQEQQEDDTEKQKFLDSLNTYR